MESAREISRVRFRAGQIEQTPTRSLPEEVVEEILSRLPVKSLLIFRCVCKFWRSLIDSKHFVKYHLEKSRKHPSFARHKIIAQSRELSVDLYPSINTGLRHCSLPSLLNKHPTYVSAFDDPLCSSNDKRLVGSCDGLVCILNYTTNFFLWNPSTHIFRQLPSVDDELNCWGIPVYGFGLDESNGDYKVFCLIRNFEGGYKAVGKVCSLKTNSWRTVEYLHAILVSEVGQFVSGKLHWLGKSYDDPRVEIFSFDLEKEMYRRMQLPSQIDAYCDLNEVVLTLAIVEECLCVLCGHLRSRLDIWVMKQYGVEESWTKVMTFPYVCDSRFRSFLRSFLKPLFLGQNGEILLATSPTFLVYSPKDKRAWNPLTPSFNVYDNVHVYIESLVSPVSSGEQ